jgi:hypothetical protein
MGVEQVNLFGFREYLKGCTGRLLVMGHRLIDVGYDTIHALQSGSIVLA